MVKQSSSRDDALVVEYCRISRDKRGTAEGVETQHHENVNAAEELNETINETFVDNDLSAYSGAERPDYQRLIESIKAGRVRLLIIRHADRLHRDTGEVLAFIKVARAAGIKIFSSMKGGFYNLDKASGRHDLIRDTNDAEHESAHRGERVADARKRQARNGEWKGGTRPYGWGLLTTEPQYRNDQRRGKVMREPCGISDDGKPVWLDMTKHNPQEADEIRHWASEIADKIEMRALLRDLAARGVQTVSQKEGRTDRQRNGRQTKHGGWDSRTIAQILLSPRTVGHAVYNGEIVARNMFPPIITEDQQNTLRTILSDPRRRTSPGNAPKWLGSLIYRCGICDDGTTMTVRKKYREMVYACRAHGHCTRPAEMLDEHVADVIVARLSRPDVADLIPRADVDVDVSGLRDELVSLDARKQDAATMWARAVIDTEQLETITATVDQRIAEVRAELDRATVHSPLSPFAYSENARTVWDGLSLARRREILRELATFTVAPPVRGRRGWRGDWVRIEPLTGVSGPDGRADVA